MLPMKIFPRSVLILLFALPFLVSCTALHKKVAEAPSISLADMELDGIKGLETIFRLQLRVINPSEEPLQIRSIHCILKVQGKSFAKGIGIAQTTVPASGTATVPVLVYASMVDLVGSVIDLLQHTAPLSGAPSKSLQYELTGSIRLGEKGKESIPFNLTGKLPPEQQ